MMKKNIIIPGIIFFAALAGFYSCKRDFSLHDPVSLPNGTAFLRIIDASPNFRSITGQADSFNVFVNGVKVTSYTPGTAVVMTYNALFPTVSSNYGYVSVPAGADSIKLSVAGVVTPDSIPIQTLTKTLAAGQLYTFLITDSINSTRDSSRIFIQDSYPQPTSGYFNLRFIHAVWNDTAGKAIDIWSARNNRNIFTNVKPGAITTFTQYSYNTVLNDTLFVRRSGTLIGLDTLSNVSFANQRTYTLYYKGDANINVNSKVKRRRLATYVHQ